MSRADATAPNPSSRIEGEERFDNLQQFFDAVHRLTTERRLSRIAYLSGEAGRVDLGLLQLIAKLYCI